MASETNTAATTPVISETASSSESMWHYHSSPMSPYAIDAKLDADYYNAEDMHGGTESLSGSGNLNYMIMQSHQNDVIRQSMDSSDFLPQDTPTSNLAIGTLSGNGLQALAGALDLAGMDAIRAGEEAAPFFDTDLRASRALVETSSTNISNTSTGAFQQDDSATARSSVSSSASNSNIVQTGPAGPAGANGSNGTDGSDGTNGNNGTDGTDGQGGDGCCGPAVINVDIDINLGDGTDIINNIVNDTFNTLDNSVDNIFTTINNTVNNVTTIITDILGGGDQDPNDTDLHLDTGLLPPLDGILQPIDVILNPVEEIVGDIDLNVGLDLDPSDGVIGIDLSDIVLAGTPLENISVPIDLAGLAADPVGTVLETIDNTLGTADQLLAGVDDLVGKLPVDLPLPQLEGLADNPIGTVTDTLNDVTEGLNSLLGGSADTGDTDLVADIGLGAPLDGLLQPVDIVLDPVESLVGDIDLNLGLDLDGTDGALNVGLNDSVLLGETLGDINIPVTLLTLEGLATDPAGAVGDAVAGLGATLEGVTDGLNSLLGGAANPADTDLAADIGLGAPMNGLLQPINVALDPVEALVGDIDLNLGLDLDGSDGALNVGLNDTVLLGETFGDINIPVAVPTFEALANDPAAAIEDTLGGLQDTAEAVADSLNTLLGDGLGDGLGSAPVGGLLAAADSAIADLNGILANDNAGGLGGLLADSPLADIGATSDLLQALDSLPSPQDGDSLLQPIADAVQGLLDTAGDMTGGGLDGGGLDSGALSDITAALDALGGGQAGGVLSPLLGDMTDALADPVGAWPETPVTDTVNSVIDSVLGGMDAGGIATPVGSVAEGLGLLDVVQGAGGGGGTSGGHHGGLLGGLFG